MQISASIGLLECSHIKFAYYVWLLLCCKSSLWWRPCGSSHHWELQLGVPQSAAMWFPLSELLSITCAVVLGISGIFITHAYLSCRNKKSGLWMSYLSSQWSIELFCYQIMAKHCVCFAVTLELHSKNTMYVVITRLSIHRNIPNSQESKSLKS